MSFHYRTVRGENGITHLTALNLDADEPIQTTTSLNPSWDKIVRLLDAGDESVWELFDTAGAIASKFRDITDRVSYDGKNILFDGDVEHDALSRQILRALESGEQDYVALARFREKLAQNPVEHSRQQAYDWLASHDFKITPDGDIVAYKGVYKTEDAGVYRSSWNSRVPNKPSAYVNGEPLPPNDYVRQSVGDTVSMPRSEVVHNPAVSCDRGLHVGTFSYARSYGDTNLEVHVNPRDFVSVPTGEGEKGRVCRYYVASVVTTERGGKSPVLSGTAAPSWNDVGYASR
jgi:hypothetical protein